MSIVCSDPHMWFVATNKRGKTQTVYNNEHYLHNYPFTFTVNFSDASVPQSDSVVLYNMTKEHQQFYAKGQHCYIAFNWGPDKKILAQGFISKIGKPSHDGTTDQFSLTFTEGTDYNNVASRKLKVKKTEHVTAYKHKKVKEKDKKVKKFHHYTETETYKSGKKKGKKHVVHKRKAYWGIKKGKVKTKRYKYRKTKTKLVNKVYRKGTTYRALIKGICAQSGIVISKIDLAKNPTLKKSFTAKGKPWTLIKGVVKKTGSVLTYIGSKAEIINPKNTKRTWFDIDDQDLIQPPTYNESSDDDSGNGTWEIVTPLVPEITTNVGIKMNSKYLKGSFYVKAGQHTFDMENAQTQCSLAKI